jgi:hypothetical protein
MSPTDDTLNTLDEIREGKLHEKLMNTSRRTNWQPKITSSHKFTGFSQNLLKRDH